MSLFNVNKPNNKPKSSGVHKHTSNEVRGNSGANRRQNKAPLLNPNHKYDSAIIAHIRYYRLQIMIECSSYYKCNGSLLSDDKWKDYSNNLIELQNKYPDESKLCVYYKLFDGFKGNRQEELSNEIWAIKTAHTLKSN